MKNLYQKLLDPTSVKSVIVFFTRLSSRTKHSTLVLTLVSFLLAIVSVNSRRRKRMRLPPGPRGWPIVGILPYFDANNPAQSVLDMSKKYGTVFCGRLGNHLAVFLNDYDSIKEAFVRKDDAFSDRPRVAMSEIYTQGHGIATCYYDNHWKEQRQFGLRALRSIGVGKSNGQIEAIITNEFGHFLRACGEKRVAFQLKPLLDMATCNVISTLTFGNRFSYKERTFQQFLRSLEHVFHFSDPAGVTNYLSFMKYLPFSGYGTFETSVRELETGLFAKERDGHKATYVSTETRDLIDAFLHEIRKKREEGVEAEQTGFTDEYLLHFIADMFAAGTDTTSNALQWVFLYAAKYEKEQSRVQEELDRVVGRDRLPALEDKRYLPYTMAFTFECARHAAAGPFGVPHSAVRDAEFRGFDIPKDTIIVPNILAVLRDPVMFPDPDEFRPSRFIDEDGQLITKLTERVNSQFGVGRRACIGDQLAHAEKFICVTHLLHTHTVTGASGADSLSLKSTSGLARTPLPHELILTQRKPALVSTKRGNFL